MSRALVIQKLKCQCPGEPISSLCNYGMNDRVKLLMLCSVSDIVSHAGFSAPKNHGVANIFYNNSLHRAFLGHAV